MSDLANDILRNRPQWGNPFSNHDRLSNDAPTSVPGMPATSRPRVAGRSCIGSPRQPLRPAARRGEGRGRDGVTEQAIFASPTEPRNPIDMLAPPACKNV